LNFTKFQARKGPDSAEMAPSSGWPVTKNMSRPSPAPPPPAASTNSPGRKGRRARSSSPATRAMRLKCSRPPVASDTVRSRSAARDSVTASIGTSRSPKGSCRMWARSSSRSLARWRNDTTARASPAPTVTAAMSVITAASPSPLAAGHRTAAAGDQLGHRGHRAGLGAHVPRPGRGLEHAGGQVDAGVHQGVEGLRPQAGGLDLTDLAAVGGDAGDEAEELLQQDHVALEALHLVDRHDAADPVRRPLQL